MKKRNKLDNSEVVRRIIVLPPHGFTADRIDLLSPHPEARKARIKIFGKINPTKKGFKPLIKELRFDYSLTRNILTEKSSAYATYSEKYCGRQLKSWKNWFYVVKENGMGNFHNLINISDEWVIVLLEKDLLDQKTINIVPHLKKLPQLLQEKINKIEQSGDEIFRNKALISEALQFPDEILIPIFIQMLNVQETGKHENCTFFALLLKLAKNNKDLVLKEVKQAMTLKTAPNYYLEDLERKLTKNY